MASDFYQLNLNSTAMMDAGSEPLGLEEMTAFMLNHTAVAFDRVFAEFIKLALQIQAKFIIDTNSEHKGFFGELV